MKNKFVLKLLKVLAVLAAFALIGVIFFYALKQMVPGFLEVLEHGKEEEIQQYIRSAGTAKGYVLTALLQFVQVVSIFFPGAPIQIAAGIIFGVFPGFLICHFSYLFANVCVFTLSRLFRKKFGKFLKSDSAPKGKWNYLNTSNHPSFMVMLSCLIPLMPNGIIPHLAARTRIKLLNFSIAVFIGSMPSTLILCAIGNKILLGDFLEAALLFGLLMIAIIILYKNQEKFMNFTIKKLNNIKLKFNR